MTAQAPPSLRQRRDTWGGGIRISDYVEYSFRISSRKTSRNSLCHVLNLENFKGTDTDQSKDTMGETLKLVLNRSSLTWQRGTNCRPTDDEAEFAAVALRTIHSCVLSDICHSYLKHSNDSNIWVQPLVPQYTNRRPFSLRSPFPIHLLCFSQSTEICIRNISIFIKSKQQ
jgi:hypothetical protein